MKIGYLGPEGTYCQEAVEVIGRNLADYTAVQYPTIYEALNAVRTGEIDKAVVPIENSIEGSVNATLDVFARREELKISGEIAIAVEHNLMTRKGIDISDIELVLSHPQALAQCSRFIEEKLPGVEIRHALSTAEGARQVSQIQNKWAAIANSKAAEVYGLEIIEKGIQDEINNVTRFVIAALEDSDQKTGKDKTSIVFSSEDRPGSLYRILDIFNLWDINLTRIESRPAKNMLGKYIFFVDLEGYREDQDLKDALTMVCRKSSFFRVLGSYPYLN